MLCHLSNDFSLIFSLMEFMVEQFTLYNLYNSYYQEMMKISGENPHALTKIKTLATS